MVLRPRDGARWLRDRIVRQSPLEQGIPWLSWPCIDYLRSAVTDRSRVFEWGGGGSTLFFLKLGCSVVTVESNAAWRDLIGDAVRAMGANGRWDLRFVPAESGDASSAREYAACVNDGSPWDLVLVDGIDEALINRMHCVETARDHVAPGGLVLLDDAWRDAYRQAPRVLADFERKEFWGLGPARLGVTKTDAYRRR